MSKIYEALERAQKERRGLEQIPRVEAEPEPVQAQKERRGLEQIPRVEVGPEAVQVEESEFYAFDLEMEEEMLHLYHSIESLLPNRKKRAIQFIGSAEGEGASTITREFARVVIATLGQTVLLLDGDRHSPTQHFFCNVSPDCCLDEVMEEGEDPEKAVYRVGASNLFVSLISRNSNSGPNVFASSGFESAWGLMKDRFDMILVDSPPATVSGDAFAMFRKVDGVVIVVEADRTRWPVVQSTKEKIVQHGGNVLGMVLNKRKYYIPEFIYKRL
jgi:Mrp family chromosome partitioning ATPase